MISREQCAEREAKWNRDNYPAEPYLDPQEYQGFQRLYYDGGYPHLRFGQAFVNRYGRPEDHPVATLFYAQDDKVAKQIIEQYYIKWDQQ